MVVVVDVNTTNEWKRVETSRTSRTDGPPAHDQQTPDASPSASTTSGMLSSLTRLNTNSTDAVTSGSRPSPGTKGPRGGGVQPYTLRFIAFNLTVNG